MLTACAEDDPQQFIKEGQALFEKGDLKEAGVQFKNALQLNPQLAEAYYGLALLNEKEKNIAAMRVNLQDTISINPNHLDAQVKLGFMFIGQLEKAKEKLGIVVKLSPNNQGVVLLGAAIKYKEGDKSEAKKIIHNVFDSDNANVEAIQLLVPILKNEKLYDEALLVLDRALQKRSADVDMHLLKIGILKEMKKSGEVAQSYASLVKKFPEDKTLRESQIDALVRIGKAELLEPVLREAVDNYPEEMSFKLALVGYLKRINSDEVEDLLKEYIKLYPNEAGLKFRLAGYYIVKKKNEDALDLYKQIVDLDPAGQDGLAAKVRLAEHAFKQGNFVLSERLVAETLVVDKVNSDALLLRAELLLNKRKVDKAVTDLRIVLRDRPDFDKALVLMARASYLNGELEVAESFWKKAIQANPKNLTAISSLAAALIKKGNEEQADELLVKAVKEAPANPSLTEALVKLRAGKKDWAGAESSLNELKQFPQSKLAAQMIAGMLAKMKGEYVDAIEIYKEVLSIQPKAVEALTELPKLYVTLGRREEFIAYLKGFVKENQQDIMARNMLAQVYMYSKRLPEANVLLQESLVLEPKSVKTYQILAKVLVKQGSLEEVEGLYKKALKVLPGNLELMMGLAGYYEHRKSFDLAISAYEGVVLKFPESEEAINNLAFLLVTYSVDQVGMQRAYDLVGRHKDSTSPYFQDTYGWVMLKRGDTEKSIVALKRAVAVIPNNAEFRYHLGESYYAAGDTAASKIELEKSIELASQKGVFDGLDRAKELLKKIEASVGV